MKLYRPVGLAELRLIARSGYTGFPSRLAIQPIFYPVLNFEYARHIAEQWNTRDPVSGYCGFVTSFELEDEWVKRYPVQVVGARVHKELWVPAELEEFNRRIVGNIVVEASYYGTRCEIELGEDGLPRFG